MNFINCFIGIAAVLLGVFLSVLLFFVKVSVVIGIVFLAAHFVAWLIFDIDLINTVATFLQTLG